MNTDAAGPCGSVMSTAADFVKWQQLHMRQAVRACVPTFDGAPFFNGPRDDIECPAGTRPGPPLRAAAARASAASRRESRSSSSSSSSGGGGGVEDSVYLLGDSAWKEYVRGNTLMPDWNAFGTYSLGMWWEMLYDAAVRAGCVGCVDCVDCVGCVGCVSCAG